MTAAPRGSAARASGPGPRSLLRPTARGSRRWSTAARSSPRGTAASRGPRAKARERGRRSPPPRTARGSSPQLRAGSFTPLRFTPRSRASRRRRPSWSMRATANGSWSASTACSLHHDPGCTCALTALPQARSLGAVGLWRGGQMPQQSVRRVLSMLCGALALGLVLAAGPSHAAPPQTIHYQGYLTSSTGAPVNGPVTIGLRIYTAASGGNLLWSDNVNVNVSNGHYQVVLGANALVPLNLEFDNPYFLAVSVGPAAMVPRPALHLVPYAYRAVAADSVAATATIGGAQISGLITAATIAGSQVTGPITAATLSGATLTSLDTRYFARGDLPPQGNTITVVDGANSFVGEYISITVGADGLPVIAYQGLGLLTVLKCGNPACSSGNSINGVGSAAGLFTSITLGADGLPVI